MTSRLLSKLEQLMTHVEKSETCDCWIWTGSIATTGYPYGKVGYQIYGEHYAHRAVYVHSGRPLTSQQMLMHKCDVPQCVNPDHLVPGTQLDNMQDAKLKGRRLGQRPRKTPTRVIEAIHEYRRSGITHREIASLVGLSVSYVKAIATGKRRNLS